MFRPSGSSVLRHATACAAAAALILTLASCSPADPSGPTPEGSAPAAGQTPTPSDAGPALVPDGTAEENLPLFSAVTAQVWSSESRGSGRAYVDALIAAGFDRAAMQVTQDVTTVGNPVESLQFSVRWGETDCLVGQVGPSTGEPVTAVLPQLAEGRCLVGTTRAIDW